MYTTSREEDGKKLMKCIAQIISRYGRDGSLRLSLLCSNLNHCFKISTNDITLLSHIHDYQSLFHVTEKGDEFIVTLTTQLDLCDAHCSKLGCSNPQDCGDLHICKFFLLGDMCRFTQKCKYGHNLRNTHNQSLLEKHMLDHLSEDFLRLLFCRDRSSMTVPKICKFYNVGKGCRTALNGKPCFALHICKFYVKGNCGFGKGRCKRSHNILDEQPQSLLKSHGFDVNRPETEVLEEYREMIDMDDGSGSTVSSSSQGSSLVAAVGACAINDDKQMDGPESDPSVCMFHLRGHCSYGNICRNVHTSKTYLWQFTHWSNDDEWHNCDPDANDALEKAFCKVDTDTLNVCLDKQMFDSRECAVEFSSMLYKHPVMSYTSGVRRVRRLGTTSKVKNPSYQFTTEWQWWWLDIGGHWRLYGEQGAFGTSTNITSSHLENAYLGKPDGEVSFKTSAHSYILDFRTMTQQNTEIGTKRDVRRRPLMYQHPRINTAQRGARPKTYAALQVGPNRPGPSEQLTGLVSRPAHWESVKADNPFYQLVEITNQRLVEFQEAANLFYKTMPKTMRIKRMQRIQNAELWDGYSRRKIWMQKKLSKAENIREMKLFHGTRKQYIEAICQQGFDWRICGSSVGTKFGKGSYFAKNASYSQDYTDCKTLIIVKVLVGDYTLGDPSMRRPPPKDRSKPYGDLYDSTVNDLRNPTIYVTYKQEQTYPEMLIHYE